MFRRRKKGTCRNCATALLTEGQWQAHHGGMQASVGNVFDILEQRDDDRGRVGITCRSCGKHYCTRCMTDLGSPNVQTGGVGCLSCGGGMKEYAGV